MIIDIPYYSMASEISDEFWKIRACGIACLKMVLEWMRPGEAPSMEMLLHEGQTIGGFTSRGWLHSHLVIILRNHGVFSYAQEFRTGDAAAAPQYVPSVYTEEFVEHALGKIVRELRAHRPVILSVPGHGRIEGQTHMVVCTGVEDAGGHISGFYYNDPQDDDGLPGKNRFISLEDFLRDWRRFCIFVE